MPMIVMSVSGRVRHIRPLPSDSTTASVPVSATPKLAPETATRARRNTSRRWVPAAAARTLGSSVSVSRSTSAISAAKMSRISARPRWMAGTRMCDGLSCPSWTMSSARSVSCAVMPAASSASLRPISWVAIDLTLTTSWAPVARTRSSTIRLASAASRAQCTVPPRAVTLRSSSSSSSGRRAIVSALMADPASRSASQSGTSPTTAARFDRIVAVAWARLRRRRVSASASRAAAGKGRSPVSCPTAVSAGGPGTRPRGIPRKVLIAPPSRRAREDLGEVDGAHAGAQPGEAAADVHEARRVARGHDLGPSREDRAHLVGEHRGRGVGVLDRERPAEAAARVRGGQLDEVDAADRPEQPEWHVADPEHVDEQLGELVGAGGDHLGTGREGLVAGPARHGRVLVADRTDARARRRDDRVAALGERPLEDVDVVAHEARRVVLVAGVRVHLPAARLRLREDDLVAEPLEEGHRGAGDVGEQHVAEAGDEEGDPHVGLLAVEPVAVDARAMSSGGKTTC